MDNTVFLVLGVFLAFNKRNVALKSIEMSNRKMQYLVDRQYTVCKEPSNNPIDGFLQALSDSMDNFHGVIVAACDTLTSMKVCIIQNVLDPFK